MTGQHEGIDTAVIAGHIPAALSSAGAAAGVHRILSPSGGEAFGAVLLVDPNSDAGRPAVASLIRDATGAPRWFVRCTHAADGPPAWLPAPKRNFEDACDLVVRAADGVLVAVWPDALGAISDAPSLATFLRTRPAFGFVFDPVGMLTPSMLPRCQEHLARLFAAFTGHPQLHAAVACGWRLDRDWILPTPLDSPAADPAVASVLRPLWDGWTDRTCPVLTPQG